jgi:hypothetical protein
MRKNCHQEKHTDTHKVHIVHSIDPSIPMFLLGQNLVKIQLEKYDFKLLYKEKKSWKSLPKFAKI